MYCEIARKSVEEWVIHGKKYAPEHEFKKEAACFVTLHNRSGELRGCIGTLSPTKKDLAFEIAENARSSATRDHRFLKVDESELDQIVIEVSVLNEPEIIEKQSQLNPKVYGIVVEHQGRRGVLLPDLQGITSIDHQITVAKQKAFISPKESVKIWRFKVEKFREEI